ncbi:hypothetical protein HOLleu_17396 [Holothuria leucospilota]|uniref:Uncharacterized protein n=1 Tax=Holothuria leucospilota TaxID=206669 RepID=A0A9Q1H898_HOLLE|nr:hypothetical protein HOLleu_17396 [Holothuria leucospilota]
MKKAKLDSVSLQVKIDRFLLSYRTTPHSFTRETPAKLFLNRELHTRLSVIKPNFGHSISQKQSSKQSLTRFLSVGEKVRVLDFRKHTGKWSQGVVSKVLGPVTYLVCVDNQFWKRHIDQIRSMHQTDPTVPCPMPDGKALGEVEGPDTASDLDVEVPVGSPRNEREHNSDTVMPTETHSKAEDQNVQTEDASSPIVVPAPVTPVKPSVSAPDPGTLVLRRSTRIRKPRVMLDL